MYNIEILYLAIGSEMSYENLQMLNSMFSFTVVFEITYKALDEKAQYFFGGTSFRVPS